METLPWKVSLEKDAYSRLSYPKISFMENKTKYTANILYAEDDPQTGRIYQILLQRAGYHTDIAEDGKTALELYEKNAYDLILLDMELPLLDGEEILLHIRTKGDTIPIIILSSVNHRETLYAGADDYLEKGCDIRDLQARIDKAIARARQTYAEKTPNLFHLSTHTSYNRITRILSIDDKENKLGSMEGKILWYFCLRPNELITAEEFCQHLWNLYTKAKDDSLRRYITFLRKALQADKTLSIMNEFGNGYRLITP